MIAWITRNLDNFSIHPTAFFGVLMQLPILVLVIACAAALVSPRVLAMDELHKKHACNACHADDKKLVGPAYADVAAAYNNPKDKKYKGDRKKTVAYLSEKVRKGGMGVWGPVPMAPNASATDAEVKAMVESILDMGKKKK
jgi:cytochrome c